MIIAHPEELFTSNTFSQTIANFDIFTLIIFLYLVIYKTCKHGIFAFESNTFGIHKTKKWLYFILTLQG